MSDIDRLRNTLFNTRDGGVACDAVRSLHHLTERSAGDALVILAEPFMPPIRSCWTLPGVWCAHRRFSVPISDPGLGRSSPKRPISPRS